MPPGEEEKARRFFRDLLGMNEEAKPEPLASRGGCWFRSGTAIVHIGIDESFLPQHKAHPAFCIENINELAAHLERNKTSIIWDEALTNRKRFYTMDPFGNRIEFIQVGDGFGDQ